MQCVAMRNRGFAFHDAMELGKSGSLIPMAEPQDAPKCLGKNTAVIS